LVQRVSSASVRVDGRTVGQIGPGLCVLLGVGPDDDEAICDQLAEKVRALRIFDDGNGKMSEPLGQRELLCVSQFTLYANTGKGNRPSFTGAAPPQLAEPLYERFCEQLGAQRGVFGALMEVELVNDGPVTLMVEVERSVAARSASRGQPCEDSQMAPEPRQVPRFAAEPPHEHLPSGRWAQRLTEAFTEACAAIEPDGDTEVGEPGEISWYPERTWHGRSYLPAVAASSTGLELFGYIAHIPGDEQSELTAVADVTSETAADNPDWQIDLCEEVVGSWRGETDSVAAMTLVWGQPTKVDAKIATAELAGLCVDQCELVERRFTLLAPDDYRGDTLEIACYDGGGRELARESLYEDAEAADGPAAS